MPIDYSKIPTADLEALRDGKMEAVSTPTLELLSNASSAPSVLDRAKEAATQRISATGGMSGIQKFMAGMGGGFKAAGTGAMQRVLEGGEAIRRAVGMPSNQANIDRLNAIAKSDREAMAQLTQESPAAQVGDFIGNALPYAAMPGGVGGGLLKRMGTSAVSGGAVGALQPTAEGESATVNALLGAVTGGGMAGALGGASKLGNVIKGTVPETDPMRLAKQHGISITLGEATNNPLWKTAESWLERVPIVGLKSFREKQNAETQRAATNFFAKYVHDPTGQTTASMKIQNDQYLDGLYNSFKKQIAGLPPGEAKAVKDATGEMLERFPSVFESIQDTHIKRILRNVYGDVKDSTVDTGILNASGKPITRKETPKFTAEELWELRKGIGREIRDAKTETARGVLNKVYSAVSDDMDSVLSQSTSPAAEAFRKANDSFKQYSVKFDVLREAYDRAAGTTKAGELFSPKIFSTALKNLANDPNYKKNVKWTPQEVEEMTGLANILQVAKRGGQFMENPPTGNRWGPLAIGGGVGSAAAMTGGMSAFAGATAGTFGIVEATKFLTTTTMGKRLSLAASKIEPQDPRMTALVNQVMNQVPKMVALEAAKTGTSTERR